MKIKGGKYVVTGGISLIGSHVAEQLLERYGDDLVCVAYMNTSGRLKALAGRNDHAKVAFGTEAGLFHTRANIPTVVCGPGDIAQAHKPNEFIPLDQIAKGEDFMRRLLEEVSAD